LNFKCIKDLLIKTWLTLSTFQREEGCIFV
jgi:hypothetical protein